MKKEYEMHKEVIEREWVDCLCFARALLKMVEKKDIYETMGYFNSIQAKIRTIYACQQVIESIDRINKRGEGK